MCDKIQEPMKTLIEQQNAEKEMIEAFIRASRKFRKPVFTKTVDYTNKQGRRIKFSYAELSEVLDCVKEPLLSEGFIIVFDNYNENTDQIMDTHLLYKNGLTFGNQKRRFSITGLSPQDVASQETYYKRYSISSICSLAADEDDDAKLAEEHKYPEKSKNKESESKQENTNGTINNSQIKYINHLLTQLTKQDEIDTLYFAEVSEMKEIPSCKYKNIVETLELRIKAKTAKGGSNANN